MLTHRVVLESGRDLGHWSPASTSLQSPCYSVELQLCCSLNKKSTSMNPHLYNKQKKPGLVLAVGATLAIAGLLTVLVETIILKSS